MNNTNTDLTHTIEETEGIWFQLWWNGYECVYSEELMARSREEAEKEAARIAAVSSPLQRIMEALGATPEAAPNLVGTFRS